MYRAPLAAGLAGVALMAAPAPAVAHLNGPTAIEAIAIADRWAAKEVPELVNHCAGGRWNVTRSNAALDAESAYARRKFFGYAEGWVRIGDMDVWDHTRCTWTTREDLSAWDRCAVDAHEMMHFVIGPQHEGPLDPRHPGPTECHTHSETRIKRTRAQIRRSIRYQRTQARIKARAIMRRMHKSSR